MKESLYLNQEMVDWLSQKKSELLAWVVENIPSDDIPFEEYNLYDHHLESLILHPDYEYKEKWEDHAITVFLKYDSVWLMLISVEITTDDDDILYPLLFVPTKSKHWLSPWLKGDVTKISQTH